MRGCRKRALPAALALTVLLAGCGGGGKKTTETKVVRGAGYRFLAPADWPVTRKSHVVSVLRPGSAADLVSVSRYELPRVPTKAQIDAAAAALARALEGSVERRSIVTVAGRPAPAYDLAYERNGDKLGLRLVFVLRGTREFQLLCRWLEPEDDQTAFACQTLLATFRPG